MINDKTQKFIEEYKQETSQPNITISAWQFGTEPDELARLVVKGKKTATCSLYKLYEIEGEPLPQVGLHQVILDSTDQPVAMIKITEVSLTPMQEVPLDFALAEGEGDGSYKYWWNGHIKFFKSLAEEFDITFDIRDLLVCERFEVVKVSDRFSY
ncbi:ASCH domain-containing protein [uncultured Psychrobacter sp.]|uniref:ASCH domain-containing protein n=1 Tax=uncultured Psychrobacter sp. TaxID=259303 RepID=UPI0025946D96|nr:ASCH domain-containing protein [uncultured Psychrobacter sp.]